MAFQNINSKNITTPPLQTFHSDATVSSTRLDIGLWFLRNRKKLTIIWIGILVAISLGTWGYSLYGFGHYMLVEKAQHQQMLADLTSSQNMVRSPRYSENLLSIFETKILPVQNSKADLFATVVNNHDKFLVFFNYHFEISGQVVSSGSDFVLPGATKYIMALQQPIPAGQLSANFVIDSLSGDRVNPHRIADWAAFQKEHLNIKIDKAVFTPGQDSGLSEKINVGQVDFKITNSGAFGYKDLRLIIVLKSNQTIVSINQHIIKDFRSGESKEVSLSWPGVNGFVNQIEIIPDVNVLDDSVYLPYSQ